MMSAAGERDVKIKTNFLKMVKKTAWCFACCRHGNYVEHSGTPTFFFVVVKSPLIKSYEPKLHQYLTIFISILILKPVLYLKQEQQQP